MGDLELHSHVIEHDGCLVVERVVSAKSQRSIKHRVGVRQVSGVRSDA